MRNKRKRNISLSPVYSTHSPNDAIQLYNGQLEIEQDSIKISTNGIIELIWLRNPKVKFSFTHNYIYSGSSIDFIINEPITLQLPTLSKAINARIIQSSNTHEMKGSKLVCSGDIAEPVRLGNGDNLSYLILHLPNFHDAFGSDISSQHERLTWLGRFHLDTDEWKITIDKVENYSFLYKELKATGGYAITHIIKVEKADESFFKIDETQILIENLFYFLSFARGFWVESVLEVGFDKQEKRVWEKWINPRTDRWQNVNSWFNFHTPIKLTYFWSNFCNKLQDSIWRESLKRAIRWYISANQKAGELEGSIILVQTAHELLSWTKFVTEKGISEEGFSKLPAADKLRLLLIEANIPLETSALLKFLSSLSKLENWDGAKAVTEIRNKLVHPSPKNIQKLRRIGEDEMQDAYILTMWYLELILLYLLGYQDEYVNRLIYMKWVGQTEQVPWT